MSTQPDSRAAGIAQAERLEAVFDAFYQEYTEAHQCGELNGEPHVWRRSFATSQAERCTPAAAALICKLAQERDGLTALLGSEPLRAARAMALLLDEIEDRTNAESFPDALGLLQSFHDSARLLLSHLPLVGLHDA